MYFVTPEIYKDHLKILMLIDNLACGGKERRLISLLKHLKNIKSIEVELALIDNIVFYEEASLYTKAIHILGRNFKHDLFVFFKTIRLIKKINPDIIHSWGSMPSLYIIPAAKIFRKKIFNAEIVNAPHSISAMQKIRTKVSFKYSDVIVANSKAGLKSYSAPTNKSFCIHNGFDFERINDLVSKEKIRKKFNIKTPKVVGMVGAIIPKKDYITFLITAIDILKMRNDISFLVVGDGEMIENYKDLTKEYDKIIYTGNQKNVESIINIFDIGVLCTNSKIHGEGISNSIMEYMALSKPVIATEGGGTSEIIENGVNGFICKSRNPNEVKEKILQIIDDQNAINIMGANSLRTIKEKFSIELMVNKTLDAYRALTNFPIIQDNEFLENRINSTKEVVL